MKAQHYNILGGLLKLKGDNIHSVSPCNLVPAHELEERKLTRAPLPAALCGGATSHPSAQHVAVILTLWISSFEKWFLKTLSIFLQGFAFLTDLDRRSLRNSGTL